MTDRKQASELVERITEPLAELLPATMVVTSTYNMTMVDNRLNILSGAVAAGDEINQGCSENRCQETACFENPEQEKPILPRINQEKAGIWLQPFYAEAKQKMKNGVSGYKLKTGGGIVGFDYQINDNSLVGIAYSRFEANAHYKDNKSGDKASTVVNMFSLYGMHYLTTSWFVEGAVSHGFGKIKNNEGRVILSGKERAIGKYTATTYTGQLITGYHYPLAPNIELTPIAGVRYTKFRDGGYQEKGTTYQNLTVKKKSYEKIELLGGIKLSTIVALEQTILIPTFHALVNYDIRGKSPKIDARLNGIDSLLPTKSFKPAKTFFNVGVGLTAKCNTMEYGIQYSAIMASKYMGHQGSVKIKFNF